MQREEETGERLACGPGCCPFGTRSAPLALLLLSVCLGLRGTARAQDAITIDEFTRTNGAVVIGFTDGRAGSQYRAHGLTSSDPRHPVIAWTNASGAVLSVLGGNQYRVTAPDAASVSFYRVVDLGPLDSDGDGVPDGVEVAFGTDPYVPDWITDSDGDGFSDGLEIVNGADPGDAESRIMRGLQPEVQFSAPTSRTIEGAGTFLVPLEFNTNYSGRVFYTVSLMSTATNGADFTHPLSGEVEVQDGAGSIALNIVDDLEVEPMEAIVLELEDDAAGTYHAGANLSHVVLLVDNDANWTGTMQYSTEETSFRLCLLRSGQTATAMLIPGPKAGGDHQGGHVIPLPPPGQNGWPLGDLVFADGVFQGTSGPLAAGSARLFGSTALQRTFSFAAVPPSPGQTNLFYVFETNSVAGPIAVGGQFSEVLAPAQSGAGFLRATNGGIFVLSRELSQAAPMTIPTTPAEGP
jgi:hypothetical protein